MRNHQLSTIGNHLPTQDGYPTEEGDYPTHTQQRLVHNPGIKQISSKLAKTHKGITVSTYDIFSSDDVESDTFAMSQRDRKDKKKALKSIKQDEFEEQKTEHVNLIEQVLGLEKKGAMPGQMLSQRPVYSVKNMRNIEYPQTRLNEGDYERRLKFNEKHIQQMRLEETCYWQQNDVKGLKKKAYITQIQKKNSKILSVTEKNDLEKLEVYEDRYPLLKLRKAVHKILIQMHIIANTIISTKFFETLSISIILANCAVMIADDPSLVTPPPFFETAENVFLILYTMEMVIKIMGMGFIIGEKAYLKDSWNILDFVIVISSYPTLILHSVEQTSSQSEAQTGQFNLGSLRTFRVLRPLKTISSIRGLKVLMQALFSAMPLLRDTLIILLFFFIIFAIAGNQLLSGILKQKCILLQTGQMHHEKLLCGDDSDCPGGYFCGKSNENPNYGVTNFDNVFYSLMCVFQSVTLEGWSDIQRMMQVEYSFYICWGYFVPLVFVGAFFLLNLTLAVINSKFTEAHKDQQMKDQANMNVEEDMHHDYDIDNSYIYKEEMSILQFITARIYAKKMIKFLRKRQEEKKLAFELKQEQEKTQMAQNAKIRRQMLDNTSHSMRIHKNGLNGKEDIISRNKIMSMENNVIKETLGEDQMDEMSEYDQLDRDIKEFLNKSKKQMIQKKHLSITTQPPSQFQKECSGAPKMKGNIGPTHTTMRNQQMKKVQDFELDLDIENVIEIDNQMLGMIGDDSGIQNSDPILTLSQKNDELWKSDTLFFKDQTIGPKAYTRQEIPGLESSGNDDHLITSESEDIFGEPTEQLNNSYDYNPIRDMYSRTREDISKSFKMILMKNRKLGHQRNAMEANFSNDSTRQEKNSKSDGYEELASNKEIEEIYCKNANNSSLKKKRIQNLEEYGQKQGSMKKKRGINGETPIQEFVPTSKPKNPFKNINPLQEKVAISGDLPYLCTSHNEVFQNRLVDQQKEKVLHDNKFLQLPENLRQQIDPDFDDNGFVRSQFAPYQQKVFYNVQEDSSQSEEEESENDDKKQQQEQPYVTCTRIGHKPWLKHVLVEELGRRSDIMITSTLSMSIFPKDQRVIKAVAFAKMNQEELNDYIDEKQAFKALVKEHQYKFGSTKDKEKVYRDSYVKSFIHRNAFNSTTLTQFKNKVKILNSNEKQKVVKDEKLLRAEKLKHIQNQRASQKRGIPKFDMEHAKKLLEGKFHEEEMEEDEFEIVNPNQAINAKNQEDLKILENMEKFEHDLLRIVQNEERTNKKPDEIPNEVRKQFNLPDRIGIYEVNFQEVRKHDISVKKQTPMWSGQDVIPDHLNNTKSQWIISQINYNRVWPLGFQGFKKRLRTLLKLLVKSSFFDSIMTFAVLLNTITLSIDHYGIEPEVENILKMSNDYFTIIFIIEMAFKLLAVGVKKYSDDRMNYLDGSVVILSILEILSEELAKGEGVSLSSFKTIRMLRTFRVFRIARLLRGLESMQTILGVMARSYKSFIYITMLMFLFIIIFSLLGMQVFGGFLNFEEGLPQNNFDSFPIAFITVFQILTMENWQTVFFTLMRSDFLDPFMVSIFFISWIFLGNFILLNLFLAILLDSFLEEEEEQETEEEYLEHKKLKKIKQAAKLRRLEAQNIFMDEQKASMIKGKNDQAFKAKMFFGEQPESEDDLEDLDEMQVMKIFKEQGLIKKDKKDIEQQKLFIDIECASSFYLFAKDNWFRILTYKMIKHSLWETLVQVLIILSSFKLAVDTYIDQDQETQILFISEQVDVFFNWAFIFEMVFKLIALGLIMDEGSYLRDSWNILDFFIVSSSILDMLLRGITIPVIKILRMLRVLRPLRFISHNVAMKMLVAALLESVGSIFNVLIVVAVVYLIFAIMGVNFFGGNFFYCSIATYQIQTEQECMQILGQWKIWDHNFDDVREAMNTLYVVSSLEGWPDIMIQAVDMTGEQLGPTKENTIMSMVFFVAFILIGSFFFLNFFIGVLFLKFNQAQREENKGFSNKDIGWMDIQKLILKAQPEYFTTNIPQEEWRKKYHQLVTSMAFDNGIMLCIFFNMIQMSLQHDNQTPTFSAFMDVLNYIFTFIFFAEAVLKLIAFGNTYFDNSWNKFDFFVVVSSLLDILLKMMENIGGESSFYAILPQIARVMRVLRVTRVVRLAGKDQGLQAILQTIVFSIPSLANVLLLLMIIYFIFSILGHFLFSEIKRGDVIDSFKNFNDWQNSFLLLYAISTGEDWNRIMFDCSRTAEDGCIEGEDCGASPFSYWYFYIMVLACSHIMLNLFILVIIQQFEKYYLQGESMITLFKNDLEGFMEVWKKFTMERYKCRKIKENQLTKFFRQLGENGEGDNSLGFNEEFYNDGDLKKQLLKMGIKCEEGYIYFNELLYRCMKRKYGTMKLSKKMQIFELKTQFQIYHLTLQARQLERQPNNNEILANLIKKENEVNPFLTIMNFKISFKTWIKFARIKIRDEYRLLGKHENAYMNDNLDDMKTINVEIEVEENFSVTSEEDPDRETNKEVSFELSHNESSHSLSRKKSIQKKKKMDHLKLFEDSMREKFKKIETKPRQNKVSQLPRELLNSKLKTTFTTFEKKRNSATVKISENKL